MTNVDFMQGYKTLSGLVVLILSVVLAKYTNEGNLTEIMFNIGQILGAILAVYGLIMKGIRKYKSFKK